MDFYRYRLAKISKWPVKNLTGLFMIIFICIFMHICLMHDVLRFVDNITSLLTFTRHREVFLPTKYLLTWDKYFLLEQRRGRNIFADLNCTVSNCVASSNRALLRDYTDFDAILFNDNCLATNEGRPQRRSSSQIYIYATLESPVSFPACEVFNDNFFNWTLTYRLDSDVVWPYFTVQNVYKEVVAPKEDVQWVKITKRLPISPAIKSLWKERTRAAAWLVTNCDANSLREEYLTKLQEHLFHFSLKIDVYGGCTQKCKPKNCEKMLRKHYFFYMAFENSMAVDYVTEKVLHGYDNYVVPIVFGGANYTRFLPPGSYINAQEHHPFNLAHMMHLAIKDRSVYETYFNWTHYYTIGQYPRNNHPLCGLCEALHSKRFYYAPAKKNFRYWWNGMNGMKWCLSEAFWNETAVLNIDGTSVYNSYDVCFIFFKLDGSTDRGRCSEQPKPMYQLLKMKLYYFKRHSSPEIGQNQTWRESCQTRGLSLIPLRIKNSSSQFTEWHIVTIKSK